MPIKSIEICNVMGFCRKGRKNNQYSLENPTGNDGITDGFELQFCDGINGKGFLARNP